MADDIGVGDIVEAVDPRGWRRYPHGRRYTVKAVFGPTDKCRCAKSEAHGGLDLWEAPPNPGYRGYCIYDFRKIGGSQAETIRRFAEDLTPNLPADAPTRETVDG